MIRLVTFDALHTLITPRKPIHVQYAEVFGPYLGTLPPDAIARSFKLGAPFSIYSSSWQDLGSVFLALRKLQAERPSYRAGVERWWSEVVSRTAVGAGADPQAVQRHLDTIVPSLMKRFSSREGYRLFDDTLPTRASSIALLLTPQLIHSTVRTLREMGVRTGLITNSDARIGGLLCCMDGCTLKAG